MKLFFVTSLIAFLPMLSHAETKPPVGCYNLAIEIPGVAGFPSATKPTPANSILPFGTEICTKESNVVAVPESNYDYEYKGTFDITISSTAGKALAHYSFPLKAIITAAGGANTIYAQSEDDIHSLDQFQPDSIANGVNFTTINGTIKAGETAGFFEVSGETFVLIQK